MQKYITEEELKKLFTKPYGTKAPSKNEWASYYQEDVLFIDPTQEKFGLDAYIEAQENLIKRCRDVYLETHAVAINQNIGFVEWTLGLKILNKEFIYPGTTRLTFGESGKIKEQVLRGVHAIFYVSGSSDALIRVMCRNERFSKN